MKMSANFEGVNIKNVVMNNEHTLSFHIEDDHYTFSFDSGCCNIGSFFFVKTCSSEHRITIQELNAISHEEVYSSVETEPYCEDPLLKIESPKFNRELCRSCLQLLRNDQSFCKIQFKGSVHTLIIYFYSDVNSDSLFRKLSLKRNGECINKIIL